MGFILRALRWCWKRLGDFNNLADLLDLLDLKTAALALFGGLLMLAVGSTNYDWSPQGVILAAFLAAAAVAIVVIALRLIFSNRHGPTSAGVVDGSYGSAVTQDMTATQQLERLVKTNQCFTIAEAACLLGGTEIRQDDITGPASTYLRVIKQRILSDKIKALNGREEIRWVKSSRNSIITAVTNQKPLDLSNEIEISKASLAQLAKEFRVDIPGLESEKPKAARPNISYQYEVGPVKLEGTPLAWAKTPHLRWLPRADGGRDIISVFIEGKNVDNKEIKLDEAYIISGVTGTRLEMKIKAVDGRNIHWVSAVDTGLIPPGAQIEMLSSELNGDEGVEETEFSKNWGTLNFVVSFAGAEHRKIYDRKTIEAALDEQKLDPPEPRVTLKKS